jgi:hypothetical protein
MKLSKSKSFYFTYDHVILQQNYPLNEGAKRQRTDLVSDGDDEKLTNFTYMRDGKE